MKFSVNRRIDNKGFSLVELLIAVAIAGIVAASVFGFMTVGAKTFSYNSADVNVQNEQQLAFNQIQDLVIDTAIGVEYLGGATPLIVDTLADNGYDKTLKLYNNDSIYEITWNHTDNKLFYSEYTASINMSGEVQPITKTVDSALMSEYITGFAVDLSRMLTSRVVRVEMSYDKNGRTLTTSHNITLRNEVVSSNKLDEKKKNTFTLSGNVIPASIKGKDIIYVEPGDTVVKNPNCKLNNVQGPGLTERGYRVFDSAGTDITDKETLYYGFASGSSHNSATMIGYSTGELKIASQETAGDIQIVVYCGSNNTVRKIVTVRVVRTTSVSVNFIKGNGAADEIAGPGTTDDRYADDLGVNETFKLEATPNISYTVASVPASERDANDTALLNRIENDIRSGIEFTGLTGYNTLFKETGALTSNPCEFKMNEKFTFGVGEAQFYTSPVSVRAFCGYSKTRYNGDVHDDWNGAAYRKKADFTIKINGKYKRGEEVLFHLVDDKDFFDASLFPSDAHDTRHSGFWTCHTYLMEIYCTEIDWDNLDSNGNPTERELTSLDFVKIENNSANFRFLCPYTYNPNAEYNFRITAHVAPIKQEGDQRKCFVLNPETHKTSDGRYSITDSEYVSNTLDGVTFDRLRITYKLNKLDKSADYSNVYINKVPNAPEGNYVVYYARPFGKLTASGMVNNSNGNNKRGMINLPFTWSESFDWQTYTKQSLYENRPWYFYEPDLTAQVPDVWKDYRPVNDVAIENMGNYYNNDNRMFKTYLAENGNDWKYNGVTRSGIELTTSRQNWKKDFPSRLKIVPKFSNVMDNKKEYSIKDNYIECVFWNIQIPYNPDTLIGAVGNATGLINTYECSYFPGPDDPDFSKVSMGENLRWYHAGYDKTSGYKMSSNNNDISSYELRYTLKRDSNLDGSAKWTLKLMYESTGHENKEIGSFTYDYNKKMWEKMIVQ